MSPEDARTARIETLQCRLRHSDPVQLWFQISEIAGDETYTRHGVSVQPGDVVIDAGANVGVAAAYFALIRQAAVIHCFEPVAPLFELLSGNLADVPGCVLHPEGLSYEEREAQITY